MGIGYLVQGTGYWVLGTGYWVLGTGYWVLGTGYWVLGTGYWVLGTGYWVTLKMQSKTNCFYPKPELCPLVNSRLSVSREKERARAK